MTWLRNRALWVWCELLRRLATLFGHGDRLTGPNPYARRYDP